MRRSLRVVAVIVLSIPIPTMPASAGAFLMLVGALLIYWAGTGLGIFGKSS